MKIPALLFALAAVSALPAAAPEMASSAPAKNWVLPRFTKEGPRSMILRGSEATPIDATRFDVVDLSITTFDPKDPTRVDTVIMSPVASFFLKENRASGAKSVRLIRQNPDGDSPSVRNIRPDLEVTGEAWTYDHAAKKITIERHTRVVLNAQMKDILK